MSAAIGLLGMCACMSRLRPTLFIRVSFDLIIPIRYIYLRRIISFFFDAAFEWEYSTNRLCVLYRRRRGEECDLSPHFPSDPTFTVKKVAREWRIVWETPLYITYNPTRPPHNPSNYITTGLHYFFQTNLVFECSQTIRFLVLSFLVDFFSTEKHVVLPIVYECTVVLAAIKATPIIASWPYNQPNDATDCTVIYRSSTPITARGRIAVKYIGNAIFSQGVYQHSPPPPAWT